MISYFFFLIRYYLVDGNREKKKEKVDYCVFLGMVYLVLVLWYDFIFFFLENILW